MRIRDNLDKKRKISPLTQAKNAVIVQSDKLKIKDVVDIMSKVIEKKLMKNMATEQEINKNSTSLKEFQNL